MQTSPAIQYQMHSKSVQDLFYLYENGHLNLEPGFQRQSVWRESDRRRLIDSITRGYPLPSIFLYQQTRGGHHVYDVIDGKQRIETLLMFAGLMRGRFQAMIQLPGENEPDWVDWKWLVKKQHQHLITAYKVQCIEVSGELGEIIDLFVRINSTGKPLTSAEKRHARYFNSPFLTTAERLARKFRDYFVKHKVLSVAKLARMKHVELICELMLAAHTGAVGNKKTALDRAMSADSLTQHQADKAAERVRKALNRVAKFFPKFRQTRFAQLADFYTLATLIEQFDREGLILTNRRNNKLAADLLTAFSTGVDTVRVKQKKAQGVKPGEEQYREYLLTVLEGTDALDQRKRRAELLRGLLESLFAVKDSDRGFSIEQRRVLWNTTAVRKCTGCSCVLTWDDFTIDHVKPWSKGGPTALENAALMCLSCNSAKGNR
jgi:hypothetical protein